jgi:hypothetical protein
VKAFTHIIWLKDDVEFNWGAEHQAAFEEIKKYLSTSDSRRLEVGFLFDYMLL